MKNNIPTARCYQDRIRAHHIRMFYTGTIALGPEYADLREWSAAMYRMGGE